MKTAAKMMMLSRRGKNDYERDYGNNRYRNENGEYRSFDRAGGYDGRESQVRGNYHSGRDYREYNSGRPREGYYSNGRRESRSYQDDGNDYDTFNEDDESRHSQIMGSGAFWMRSPRKNYEKLTKEKAKEWVESMENEDESHPDGGKWTMEEVKPYAQKVGISVEGQKFIDFYAMMNAMYSDYYKVAKEFNVANPDFFAKMAKAWIDDSDAVKGKTAIYYDYIVKH